MRTKLQAGETVALIVRKHWLVLVKPMLFLAAVLLYLPVRHVKILGFRSLAELLAPLCRRGIRSVAPLPLSRQKG